MSIFEQMLIVEYGWEVENRCIWINYKETANAIGFGKMVTPRTPVLPTWFSDDNRQNEHEGGPWVEADEDDDVPEPELITIKKAYLRYDPSDCFWHLDCEESPPLQAKCRQFTRNSIRFTTVSRVVVWEFSDGSMHDVSLAGIKLYINRVEAHFKNLFQTALVYLSPGSPYIVT